MSEVRGLLNDLHEIQASFADKSYSKLPPKLAALAAWQESVLNNVLVARVRLHTGASPVSALVSTSVPTAHTFVEQQRPSEPPRMPPPSQPMPRPRRGVLPPGYIVAPRSFSMDNQVNMLPELEKRLGSDGRGGGRRAR